MLFLGFFMSMFLILEGLLAKSGGKCKATKTAEVQEGLAAETETAEIWQRLFSRKKHVVAA